MKRVLVTGASGFLGSKVVSELLERDVAVRCLLRPSSSTEALNQLIKSVPAERLEIIRGHLTHPATSATIIEGCDTVYHIAAELMATTPVLFMSNVVATRFLINAACNAGIDRFVLVSSLGVYGVAGIPNGGCLDEKCPLDPQPHLRDSYSYSKIIQEEVAWKAYHSAGLRLVVVRPGVIYGPERECLTSRVGLRKGNFMMLMGGKHSMPYTHIANCAESIIHAGEVAGIEGEAFNIVDDELPSGRQLLARYRAEVRRIRFLTVPQSLIPTLSGAVEWYHRKSRGQIPAFLTRYKSQAMWRPLQYSNAKAKRLLHWSPKIGLEHGLRETLDWLRINAVNDG